VTLHGAVCSNGTLDGTCSSALCDCSEGSRLRGAGTNGMPASPLNEGSLPRHASKAEPSGATVITNSATAIDSKVSKKERFQKGSGRTSKAKAEPSAAAALGNGAVAKPAERPPRSAKL